MRGGHVQAADLRSGTTVQMLLACPSLYGYDALPTPRRAYDGLDNLRTRPERHLTGFPQETSFQGIQETGLDFFGARYYSGGQGRFTSPDEPLNDQDQSDPLSWNLYSYVRNNPLRFIDPTGRECVTLDNGTTGDNGQGKMCQAVLDADKNKKPDVTVTDFEPPSPLLLAVAQGAQRAGPAVNAMGIATGVVLTGGAVGIGVGAIGGGTGLISLSIGATRAAQMAPLLLPAGQKLAQIIARLGQGAQNPSSSCKS